MLTHRWRGFALDTHFPVKSVLDKESMNHHTEWRLGGTNASYEGSAIYEIAMTAPLRRSTRIDGSAGGEPLSCGTQSTYNRVANAGNLHRLSPFQMPFGILHNLTGKSSLAFSIEKSHFITAIGSRRQGRSC